MVRSPSVHQPPQSTAGKIILISATCNCKPLVGYILLRSAQAGNKDKKEVDEDFLPGGLFCMIGWFITPGCSQVRLIRFSFALPTRCGAEACVIRSALWLLVPATAAAGRLEWMLRSFIALQRH